MGKFGTVSQNTPNLVIDNCTPIGSETFNESTLSLYPNPLNGILNFVLDKITEDMVLTISGLNGRIVCRNEHFDAQKSIDIHSFQARIYLGKRSDDGICFIQKIIKNRDRVDIDAAIFEKEIVKH